MKTNQKKNFLGMDQYDLAVFSKRYGIGFVMLGIIVILMIVSPTFRTPNNVITILLQISINGVLALGMVFVMTAGGIDLSIGSMLALTSTVIGVVLMATENILLACICALVVTTLLGFLNGWLVAYFDMFPFVTTLATQLVIRGLAYFISDGASIMITVPSFKQIGNGRWLGVIPYPVIILLGISILAYLLLHCSKFGRYIYAVGGNINAATASGVNVFRTRIGSFMIMGFCAGVAGIIMASRISAAQPNVGIGYETDAIAACVIGGTSFAGGVSTIPGTVMGFIIIGLIYNGMNLLGVSSYWQTIMKGVLIIGAVLLDLLMNKKRK